MLRTAVVSIAVWGTGVAAVAALVYAVNRPVTPAASLEEIFGTAASPRPPQTPTATLPTVVSELAANMVGPQPLAVARRVRQAARALAPPAPAGPRELGEMRCSDWQELEQGPATQRVRRCE